MKATPTRCCGVYPPQEVVDNIDTPLFKGALQLLCASSTLLQMVLAWLSISVAEELAASRAEEDPPLSEEDVKLQT
jgi:hypothetical protein